MSSRRFLPISFTTPHFPPLDCIEHSTVKKKRTWGQRGRALEWGNKSEPIHWFVKKHFFSLSSL